MTNEEGQALADEYSLKMQYFETSAKQDTDVQTVRSVSASAARRHYLTQIVRHMACHVTACPDFSPCVCVLFATCRASSPSLGK